MWQKGNLRKRMEHATDAIHRRTEELLKDENADSISELRNTVTTLAGRVSRESGQAISGRF
jgi:hypothetical protein